MSEAKFTPGPWHQDKYENIKDAKGDKIRVNGVSLPHRADVESIANSHLFTAAPEMYEALGMLLETHCCDTGEVDYSAEWDGDHTVCAVCKPCYAALAKARGEAQ